MKSSENSSTGGSSSRESDGGASSSNASSSDAKSIGGASSSGDSSSRSATGGAKASSDGTKSSGGTKSSSRSATSGVGAVAGVCSAPATRTNRHPGDYDYVSCNKCHNNWWGGWLYNNTSGDAWVAGATVTVNNDDGSKVDAITEEEGFFYLEGKIGSAFTPCVSKCPYTLCATKKHNSSDCQTPACHGGRDRLIYLPQPTPGQNTGGASSSSDCTPPASGGPRVHSARDYDSSDRDCRICHDSSYTGGYVYDDLGSNTVISMATVTIKPTEGEPITAVSGPGGMFYLGEVGAESTRIPLVAPYIACVSKCPNTVCSAIHESADNCSTCHNDQLRIYVR